MQYTREKIVKIGIVFVTLLVCITVVGVILTGINQFKFASQLASINQVSNLSHLLVSQQAKLFSLMLIKEAKTDELTESLDIFAQENFIIDANLYSDSGVLIAQSKNATPFPAAARQNTQNTQQIVEPIFNQQELIGFLRVTFDSQYAQTSQYAVNTLFHLLYGELIILFLAGGIFVSSFYGFPHKRRILLQPLIKSSTLNPTYSGKSNIQRFYSRRRAFRHK
ncbi:membrane protein [Nicoletella semolina]|uniref:Membrane protein n=1 Tax=Nicoletella semolina TaxID=271160 RepID=A0A4R2N7C3_9PAST|nr:AhpA/YtjB family protein [Nicoletella semolina]MDH2924388.1 hemolysin regulation protein AhpA [Nicoletella semolina]TCP16832.1 membrane protein [Nicoletella semolina]